MDVLLNSSFEAEEPEIRFYNWATGKLQLQQGELNYNTCMKFLASYVALEIFVIGATGTPPATLYGPISKSQCYPVDRCLEIWNAVNEDATKLYAIRNVLKRICDRSDTHPFKSVNGKRDLHAYIDTLGGICNMTQRINLNDSARREILIATRNNDFMGLVFVSYANGGDVRGLMPYGIQRSVFYLPDTCRPPEQSRGFVDALFGEIEKIVRDNAITHIFTWPLPAMMERFRNMGYTIVPKNTSTGPDYKSLRKAVESIYGRESPNAKAIMNRELKEFDFVLRTVDQNVHTSGSCTVS